MAIVTINAEVVTTIETATITLNRKTTTEKAYIDGTTMPSPTGVDVRDGIIAEYEGRGYSFDGEIDCKLYFTLEETSCDYDSKQQEISNLLADGFTVTDNINCTLTFEKSGYSPLYLDLGTINTITDSVVVDGEYSESFEQEEVIGQLITTTNEQDLIDKGYLYEGIIDCRKVWSKEISLCEFDNKVKTIAEYVGKGYELVLDANCELSFTGTFSKCDYLEKELLIKNYEVDGYTLLEDQDCKLHFQKNIESITNQTDVYAFFDTTSMRFQDGIDAAATLQIWFSKYQQDNPDYEGNLYIIPIYYERYVDYLDIIKKGTGVGKVIPSRPTVGNAAFNVYGNADWIKEVGVYPPNFDYITTQSTNTSWTPPTDVLMLAFMDEANPDYHKYKSNSLENPTAAYNEDLIGFKTILGEFNFFKAVLYPIVQQLEGNGGALILQSMAAIKGKVLTQSEIDSTDTLVDVSPLLTSNPYTDGLNKYGWIGVYDKTSPAANVFNSTGFGEELNKIILSGVETDSQKEDIYIDGTFTEYTDDVVVKGVNKVKKEYVYLDGCEIPLEEGNYFKDASFTVGYSPITGSWISYYSFIPNYYINQTDHFKTGKNSDGTLWSHLLTNKSFQVFYGQKEPWIIDLPVKEQYVNKTLKDISYYLDAKKNSGQYDYSELRNEGFNKAWVYNNRANSGELNLIPNTGLLSLLSQYPNMLSPTQQEILYSDTRGKHRFNYFFDRVKNDMSNEPIWKWDLNQIHKELNPDALSFTSKPTLEYIRGDWFSIRLQQDIRTDLRYEFKWLESAETIINP